MNVRIGNVIFLYVPHHLSLVSQRFVLICADSQICAVCSSLCGPTRVTRSDPKKFVEADTTLARPKCVPPEKLQGGWHWEQKMPQIDSPNCTSHDLPRTASKQHWALRGHPAQCYTAYSVFVRPLVELTHFEVHFRNLGYEKTNFKIIRGKTLHWTFSTKLTCELPSIVVFDMCEWGIIFAGYL